MSNFIPSKIKSYWQAAITGDVRWQTVNAFIDGMIYSLPFDAPDDYLEDLLLLRAVAALRINHEITHKDIARSNAAKLEQMDGQAQAAAKAKLLSLINE